MDKSRDDASIEVTDGPYHVRGLPLLRRRIVQSEHGEPLAWETVDHIEVGGSYYLCRCGGSSNKPFCDSTHRRIGFEGSEQPDEGYDARARSYEGTGMSVRDDRGRCAHAGFCATRVSNIWKQVKNDEVANTLVRSQVIAAIARCPSGALTFRLPGSASDVEEELLPAVTLVPDGPLFVTGGVPIQRRDGTAQEQRQRITLCRCGASKHKPLCDGSHAEAGFSG